MHGVGLYLSVGGWALFECWVLGFI